MADLDSLNIRISASTADASNAIDRLITSLGNLNSSLNNFLDTKAYAQGFDRLVSGFESISASVNSINPENVNALAKAINSLKSASKGLDKVGAGLNSATTAANGDTKAIDSGAKKATQDLANEWNITSKEGIQELTTAVEYYFDAVRSGQDTTDVQAYLKAVIRGYSELGSTIAGTTSEINDYVHAIKGIKFEDSKTIDNFTDSQQSIRAQLGAYTRTRGNAMGMKGSITPAQLAEQMNQDLGTSIDTSGSEAQTVQQIIDLLNKEKEAKQELNQAYMNGDEAYAHLVDSMNQLQQAAQGTAPAMEQTGNAINATTETVNNATGFQNIVDMLHQLQGITLPDFSQLATLASSIQRLGSGNAQTAQQNLSGLASGIQQLGGVTAQFAGVNFDGLTSMISAIRGLGSKSATAGGTNLTDLAAKLQALANVKFSGDTATNVAALATAIAKFGYSSAQTAVKVIPQLATAFAQLITTLQGAGTVDQSVINLANAMANLASQGQKISSASKGMNQAFRSVSTGAGNVRKSAFSLAAIFGKIYANLWLLMRGFRLLKKSIDLSSDLTETQNVVDTVFGQASKDVEKFAKSAVQELGMSELTAKQVASQYQAMGSAMGISAQSVAKASELVDSRLGENAKSYIKNADSMADMSLNLTRLAGDMASFYNVDIEDVAEDLQSVFTGQTRPLRQYGLDLTQATLKEWAMKNGLDSDIKSMSQAEKTLLRYQYVMANTTNSQGDFIKTADTWANVLRTIQEQFKQLGQIIGGSFINAFKPIAIAFRNAMNTVLKLAEKAANALGQIFGWKVEIQEVGILDDSTADIADNAEDTAKSTDKANKKAKELKRTILGFDELNVLNDNSDKDNSGKGGSGGGGADASGNGGATGGNTTVFKLRPIYSDITNLGDLGKQISNKLSEAMEGIDWAGIYGKASDFGKGLAEYLNGLINPRLFYNLGRTIANALNTALYFLDSFGETFDWKNFGESIAAGINGFFQNFKFRKLAHTLNVWAKGLFTTVTTAIANIKWSQVFDGIRQFLQELDLGTVAIIISALVIKKILKMHLASSALQAIGSFFGTRISQAIAAKLAPALGLELSKGQGLTALAKSFGTTFGNDFIIGFKAMFTKSGKKELQDISTSWLDDSSGVVMKNITGVVSIIAGATTSITAFLSQWKDGFSGVQAVIQGIGTTIAAVGATLVGGPIAGIITLVAGGVAQLAVALHDLDPKVQQYREDMATLGDEIGYVAEQNDGMYNSLQDVADAAGGQGATVGYWRDNLDSCFDSTGHLKQGCEELANNSLAVLNDALGTEYKITGDVITNTDGQTVSLQKLSEEVDTYVKNLQRKSILESMSNDYSDLLQNQANAQQAYNDAVDAYNKAAAEGVRNLDEYGNKVSEAYGEYGKATTALQSTEQVMREAADTSNYTTEQVVSDTKKIPGAMEEAGTRYSNDAKLLTKTNEQLQISNGELVTAAGKNAADYANRWEQIPKKHEEVKNKTKSNLDKMVEDEGSFTNKTKQKIDEVQGYIEPIPGTVRDTTDKYKQSLEEASQANDSTASNTEKNKNVVASALDAFKAVAEKTSLSAQAATTDYANATTSMKDTSTKNFEDINKSANDELGTIKDKSHGWASDMMKNFIQGIKDKWDEFKGWVDKVGNKIRDTMKHSVPKVGPLKDDDKWMPDMMDNFINGIKSKMPQLESAVGQIASTVSGGISGDISLGNMHYKDSSFPMADVSMSGTTGRAMNSRPDSNTAQIQQGIAVGVENAISNALPGILQRYVKNGDTVIRIGDEDIARAASRGQRKIDKRYNPSIQIG